MSDLSQVHEKVNDVKDDLNALELKTALRLEKHSSNIKEQAKNIEKNGENIAEVTQTVKDLSESAKPVFDRCNENNDKENEKNKLLKHIKAEIIIVVIGALLIWVGSQINSKLNSLLKGVDGTSGSVEAVESESKLADKKIIND